MTVWERRLSIILLANVVVLLVAGSAWAAQLSMRVAFDDRLASESSTSQPVRISPNDGPEVRVTIDNEDDSELVVRSIRIQGGVLGLKFFSYDTAVSMTVPAGSSDERRFQLNPFGIDDQAIGLMPATISVIGEGGNVLDERDFVADARGSLISTYGLCGLAVALMTVAGLVMVVWALVKAALPSKPWLRALRLGALGVGLGLSAMFVLSVTRVMVPSLLPALLITVGLVVVLALTGWLTAMQPIKKFRSRRTALAPAAGDKKADEKKGPQDGEAAQERKPEETPEPEQSTSEAASEDMPEKDGSQEALPAVQTATPLETAPDADSSVPDEIVPPAESSDDAATSASPEPDEESASKKP